MHASNATRTAGKLVRAARIQRMEDTADRRLVGVALTPAGSELVHSVIGHRRDALADVQAEMDPDERSVA